MCFIENEMTGGLEVLSMLHGTKNVQSLALNDEQPETTAENVPSRKGIAPCTIAKALKG